MKGAIARTVAAWRASTSQHLAGIPHLREVPAWHLSDAGCEGSPDVQGPFTERTTFKGQRYDPRVRLHATLPPYNRRPA